jgi:hypothetical protein
MTHCFRCEAGLPDGMNYCLNCGVRLDGDAGTVIRDLSPVPPQLAEAEPMPAEKKFRILSPVLRIVGVGLFVSLLALLSTNDVPTVSSLYTPHVGPPLPIIKAVKLKDPPRTRTKPFTALSSKVNVAQTTGMETVKVYHPAPPAVLKALPPAVALARASAKPPIAKPRLGAVIAPKQALQMRTRIEIVDGLERCYSLPGGREISC